ncbi:MAG TPA: transcription termination factor NusA [candidate division Zixibacteria bacterium]|nr:transcription termination factor NusA [candidate division Zixibacteria bacterium]
MASELYNVIDALSREKGINPDVVVSAVEDAIVVATRKFYKTQETLRAVLDKETGQIHAYVVKQILATDDEIEDDNLQISLEEAQKISPDAEVGGELMIEKSTEGLGRIAAQLAKQVILQKVREAERDTVFNEYVGRVNEVVNATVKRIEGQDIIFDIGKAEARMPKKEQSKLESFAIGERVRVVIARVEKASKGPSVVVSRAAPELVSNLFQTEVPEIYDNTVVIRAIAREAGERTKIAVMSRDKDVDAVGACVGMKGMRVQSIIRELRGEKIDIIEYHEDPVTFAEKALQPAKVSRVSVLESGEKHLEVIVDDSQLSLAIGKKGQNVRLAAKLLGWKIDIKSEEEKRQEVEQQMSALVGGANTPLEQISQEIGEGIIEKLNAAGITTIEGLADMHPEQLEQIPGIGPKTVEKISVAVNNYFSSLEGGGPADDAAAQDGETLEPPAVEAGEELQTGPDSAGQSGDNTELSDVPEMASESVAELEETEQSYEAEVIDGVEHVPPADEAEVHTHEENPGEDQIAPEKK